MRRRVIVSIRCGVRASEKKHMGNFPVSQWAEGEEMTAGSSGVAWTGSGVRVSGHVEAAARVEGDIGGAKRLGKGFMRRYCVEWEELRAMVGCWRAAVGVDSC